MANELMKSKSPESAEERRARILNAVAKLKEEGGGYTPFEGGVNFLRLDGNTGNLTFGRNSSTIPAGQKFIVPMEGVQHGVREWNAKKVTDERLCLLIEGPAPRMPEGGISVGSLSKPRERDGWNDVIDLRMIGFGGELDKIELEFSCANDSGRQAGQNLLAEMLAATNTKAGEEGFFNPVIEMSVGSYENKNYNRTVYFPVFTIVGWTDGYDIRDCGALAVDDKTGAQDMLADAGGLDLSSD